jgi:hypothetical protein
MVRRLYWRAKVDYRHRDGRVPWIEGMVIRSTIAVLLVTAVLGLAVAQSRSRPASAKEPEAEFHMARLIYSNAWGFAGGGFGRPWWAIDYPEAEYHFRQGVRRLTRINMAEDSRHLRLTDDAIFSYPWLFAQQVGRWSLSEVETASLREYLLRGGFLVADDFHGASEWEMFAAVMRRVFPDRPIVDIPDGDEVFHVLYDLDQKTQLPGRRMLYEGSDGTVQIRMQATPGRWRGIYDDEGHLMVVINFNSDTGDSWEHADDPVYPQPLTALGYRFGINYVVYAMTH